MSVPERFRSLAEGLKNDSAVEVLRFHCQEGLEQVPFDQYRLPYSEDIERFYREVNGLQLVWIRKDNELYDASRHRPKTSDFDWLEMWVDDYPYDGSVILLPFEVSFGYNWKNRVWFDVEQKYPTTFLGKPMTMLDFKKRIIPFDVCSKYYSFSYYLDDPDDPYTILLGQDHGADYVSSRRLLIEEYIDLVLQTGGEVKRRAEAMKTIWGSLF